MTDDIGWIDVVLALPLAALLTCMFAVVAVLTYKLIKDLLE